MKKSLTNELNERILKHLFEVERIWCWRNSVGGTAAEYTKKDGTTKTRFLQFGKVGSGDIQGYIHPTGRGFFIELKLYPDKQSEEQIGFEKNCIRTGVVYILAAGKTPDEAFNSFLTQWNNIYGLPEKTP